MTENTKNNLEYRIESASLSLESLTTGDKGDPFFIFIGPAGEHYALKDGKVFYNIKALDGKGRIVPENTSLEDIPKVVDLECIHHPENVREFPVPIKKLKGVDDRVYVWGDDFIFYDFLTGKEMARFPHPVSEPRLISGNKMRCYAKRERILYDFRTSKRIAKIPGFVTIKDEISFIDDFLFSHASWYPQSHPNHGDFNVFSLDDGRKVLHMPAIGHSPVAHIHTSTITGKKYLSEHRGYLSSNHVLDVELYDLDTGERVQCPDELIPNQITIGERKMFFKGSKKGGALYDLKTRKEIVRLPEVSGPVEDISDRIQMLGKRTAIVLPDRPANPYFLPEKGHPTQKYRVLRLVDEAKEMDCP